MPGEAILMSDDSPANVKRAPMLLTVEGVASGEAQLAVLSGVAAALVRSADVEATLGDVLASCLEAGGIDRCALFRADGSVPRLTHVLGFPESTRAEIAAVFGHPAPLLQAIAESRVTAVGAPLLDEAEATAVLARAGVGSALFIPLTGGGRCVGALLLGMQSVAPDPGQLAFGRALGAYLGQALVLTETFARERAARVAAEEANRAKDEFLSMLGHELRNPLTPIVTALHLMKLRASTVCERERNVIERQVNQLIHLIDDLLDVSRIARGKVELKRQRFELAEAVTRALQLASPLLEQRAHHLEVNVPATGLCIDGDLTRLSQVIGNLVNNAAKYTPKEGAITLTAVREGTDVVLHVRDCGIGITAELLPRVFDLFAQEHQAGDRAPGGLGLGLSIVRNLVTLHGGTVSVRSEGQGKGSEFTIRLPAVIKSPASAKPTVAVAKGSAASAAARRILVVDDNLDAAKLFAEVLEAAGHVTRVAHDGLSALRVAEEFKPQVALLNIGLPAMDGYELASRLHQLPGLGGVRLIAITGYGQEIMAQRSQEAGFIAHLAKPIEIAQLEPLLAAADGAAHHKGTT